MEEIWKDILGYEGYYQISNKGNVRSVDRTFIRKSGKSFTVRGKMRKVRLNNCGYCYIVLCKGGNKKPFYIHRLVASHFLQLNDSKMEVDHINTIKTDNNVDNLRWVSKRENANNPLTIKHLREAQIESCQNNKKRVLFDISRMKKIAQYTPDGVLIAVHTGLNSLCRNFGFSRRNIQKGCKSKNKIVYGFKWAYLS